MLSDGSVILVIILLLEEYNVMATNKSNLYLEVIFTSPHYAYTMLSAFYYPCFNFSISAIVSSSFRNTLPYIKRTSHL